MEHDESDEFPSWWEDGSLLVAVNIGIDESGNADTLLVGMQVGIVQKARKMHNAWKSVLRKEKIPFFHSVDYDNYEKGVFRNLTRDRRKTLLETLAAHLRRRLFFGVTSKITVSAYNAKTDNKLRSQWAAAYSFSIQMLLNQLTVVMKAFGLGDEVNIVIEEGHPNSMQALQILQKMKKVREHGTGIRAARIPLHILNVGLGAKADHPMLQAADMLAYSEWQKLSDVAGDIYNQLHVERSRYQTGYLDLDEDFVDLGLEIARRSDEAKAILKQAHWHRTSGKTEGLNELLERIRKFRQDYAEVNEILAQSAAIETECREDEKSPKEEG